jgi:hypothetical protein
VKRLTIAIACLLLLAAGVARAEGDSYRYIWQVDPPDTADVRLTIPIWKPDTLNCSLCGREVTSVWLLVRPRPGGTWTTDIGCFTPADSVGYFAICYECWLKAQGFRCPSAGEDSVRVAPLPWVRK